VKDLPLLNGDFDNINVITRNLFGVC